MDYLHTSEPDLSGSLSKVLFGFFGVVAAFLFLPKTLKFIVRRLLFGIAGEVIAVVVAGLLTEKAVEQVQRDRPQRQY